MDRIPVRLWMPAFSSLAVAGLLLACAQVFGIDESPPLAPLDGADASAIGDGEAPADAASDGARFCADLKPKPAFCLDFDDDASLRDSWKNDPIIASGTLDFDGECFRSARRSALCTLPSLLTVDDHASAFFVTERATVPQHNAPTVCIVSTSRSTR